MVDDLGPLGAYQTSQMNLFVKIFIDFRLVTINVAYELTISLSLKQKKLQK